MGRNTTFGEREKKKKKGLSLFLWQSLNVSWKSSEDGQGLSKDAAGLLWCSLNFQISTEARGGVQTIKDSHT